MHKALIMVTSLVVLGVGPALAATPAVTTDPSPPMTASPMPGMTGDAGMSGMRPMHGQARRTAPRMTKTQAYPTDTTDSGPKDYRGGTGSPSSSNAANTSAANTRSQIAPRLPDPEAETNTPEAYLMAARRALSRGQTGAAQEALERAETRALTRSTEPSMAGSPDSKPLVQQISTARQALANRNMPGAQSAISDALGDGGRVGRAPEMRMNGAPR